MSRGDWVRGRLGVVGAWVLVVIAVVEFVGIVGYLVRDRQERWMPVQAAACDAGAGWVRLNAGPGMVQLVCEQVEWQ